MMQQNSSSSNLMVCIGAFAGAHGVRGRVHVKSFMENPSDLFDFEAVYDQEGQQSYHFLNATPKGNCLYISHIKEVQTREQADALKGQKIFVPKANLPHLSKDEFYHEDLVGLAVYSDKQTEQVLGMVKAVHNFGAGDVLELEMSDAADTIMLPFTHEMFPHVDLKHKQLVLNVETMEPYLGEEQEGAQ